MDVKVTHFAALGFFLFITNSQLIAQPSMDGTFDGTGTWGASISSNNLAGWGGGSAQELYVTWDDDYIYFGAEVTAENWQSWGFAVNTKSGGFPGDPYGHKITFDHSDSPDFWIRGGFTESGYADQLVRWGGEEYEYLGQFSASEFGVSGAFVEVRIARNSLDNPESLDVQFFITGDNSAQHGSFSSLPVDNQAQVWDVSTSPTSLSNYASVSIPAVSSESTSYYIKAVSASVTQTDTVLVTMSGNQFAARDSLDSYQFHLTIPSGLTYLGVDTAGTLSSPGSVVANVTADTLKLVYASSEFSSGDSVLVRLRFKGDTVGDYTLTPRNVYFRETVVDSVISGTISVTEIPVAAKGVLSAPSSGSTGIDTVTTLTWLNTANADSFTVQLSTDAFNTLLLDSTKADTSVGVSGLSYETTYSWRVRAKNRYGTGEWSDVWTFTTEASPIPSKIQLSSPANGSTGADTMATLMWFNDANADSFTVEISAGEVIATLGTAAGDTSVSAGGLDFETTYTWRVKGTNSYGDGEWSDSWTFTTAAEPVRLPGDVSGDSLLLGYDAAMILQYSVGKDPLPTVDPLPWEPWRLSVADVNQDNQILAEDAALILQKIVGIIDEFPGPSKSLNPAIAVLVGDGALHFHVAQSGLIGFNLSVPLEDSYTFGQSFVRADGAISASNTDTEIFRFGIASATPMEGTFLKLPVEWKDGSPSGTLTVEIYSNNERREIEVALSGLATSVGDGDASGEGLPTEYALAQNHPNPFNPSTAITYSMPKAGHAVLEVFDLSGRAVARLVDGMQAAGHHTVQFDASALSSGLYIYTLRTGEFTATRKMMLVK